MDEGTARPQFIASSLLAAIYAYFAFDELGALQPIERRCEFCRQPMQVSRRDPSLLSPHCLRKWPLRTAVRADSQR
jgi:hypothetical protein